MSSIAFPPDDTTSSLRAPTTATDHGQLTSINPIAPGSSVPQLAWVWSPFQAPVSA
jgi:hypothetical protein